MKAVYKDGTEHELCCSIVYGNDYKHISVKKEHVKSDVDKIFFDELNITPKGNDGYFLFPRCSGLVF